VRHHIRLMTARPTRSCSTHSERHPVKRLRVPILLLPLLISLISSGGALAQQDPLPPGFGDAPHGGPAWVPYPAQAAPLVAPRGLTRQFQTRFDVFDAPEQFQQVLQIIDFPSDTWTPLHTVGGRIYHTVIDGTISTRLPWTEGVYEAAFQAGDTFVLRPGEYLQVGNATAGNTRMMATALLPISVPLTIYQDGRTSSAYPTFTDRNYTHATGVPAPGPTMVYRSAREVDTPEGAFEFVQLVLELKATDPLLLAPAAEVREACLTAWSGASSNMLDVEPYDFERVAANLCVSSRYVPVRGAPRGT
jgi:hypothetical protein